MGSWIIQIGFLLSYIPFCGKKFIIEKEIRILIFKIKDGSPEWSTVKTQLLAKNTGADVNKKILEWGESISIMSLGALDSPVIIMIIALPLDMNMNSESWEIKNMIYNWMIHQELTQEACAIFVRSPYLAAYLFWNLYQETPGDD